MCLFHSVILLYLWQKSSQHSRILKIFLHSEQADSGYEADDDVTVGFDGNDLHGQEDGGEDAVDQAIVLIHPAEVLLLSLLWNSQSLFSLNF